MMIRNKVILSFFASLVAILSIYFNVKAQNSLPSPPNTAWLKDNLYLDKTEIANIHWLEYLEAIKKDSSQAFYLSQIPDEKINRHEAGFFYTHPAFRFKPVIGISYEQVLNFCRWRSIKFTNEYQRTHSQDSSHYQFIFRLPSDEEWEMGASGGRDRSQYPFGLAKIEKIESKKPARNEPPAPLINYKSFQQKGFQLVDIQYFDNPNDLGIYNMIGNVAEMIEEDGKAKGGSWKHRLDDCKIRAVQYYYQPENWLGFRCICEVKLIHK